MSRYNLLLATALATIISLPAYATETTASPGTDVPTAAASEMEAPPVESPHAVIPSEEKMEAITGDAAPAEAPAATGAPELLSAEPVPAAADTPLEAPVEATAPAPVIEPTPEVTTPVETPAETAAPVTTEPEPAPVVEEKPVVKAKPKPAKLSALSKKYGLLDLDKDGNKSLSRAEFTADGYANDKLFNRYDGDKNGKLTTAEINAYARNIEASINK